MKKAFAQVGNFFTNILNAIKNALRFIDEKTNIVVIKQIKIVIVAIFKAIYFVISKVVKFIVGIFVSFFVSIFRRRLNRSKVGDIALILVLILFGLLSAWPLIFVINNAFKPFNELFLYPPKLFVQNPTMKNFSDLFTAIESSWVPFSRYIFNSLFITIVGTIGHIFIASLAAYPLAKYNFKGKKLIFSVIVLSLMFSDDVTYLPQFIILSRLGLLDTFWSILLPAFQYTMGLYLMKQFMQQVPDSLLEAAKIDGATHLDIYWHIMMPLAKPAWLTLGILLFQRLWGVTGGDYIYTEKLKTMNYALGQIVTGGVSRTGVSAALSLIMISVPVTIFIINQSSIMDTMATSGMKD